MIFRPLSFLFFAALIACDAPSDSGRVNVAEDNGEHRHQVESASPDPSSITLGNGDLNRIAVEDIRRIGPTLIVSNVTAEKDSFLVLHPFKDGAPVQTDYVAATFIPAGIHKNVSVRLDDTPDLGTPFIIMLHHDVNQDGVFQFGDGVTVLDAPVFEGANLIAIPMQAPTSDPVTPGIIRSSAQEHSDKATNFIERRDFRDNALHAEGRALIHRYLAIVEGIHRNGEAAAPLLADNFLINFPSGPITTLDQLDRWLNGPAASLDATRHVLHTVSMTPKDNETYGLDMTMMWDGLTNDGGRMTAKTQHSWIVHDTTDGLKIVRIDVNILEPFASSAWE